MRSDPTPIAQSSSQPRPPSIQLRKFDKTSALDSLKLFEMQMKLLLVPEQNWLTYFLSIADKQTVDRILTFPPDTPWKEVRIIINDRFQISKDQLFAELSLTKQRSDESVAEYSLRFQKIASKVGIISPTSDIQHTIILFLNSVNPKLKTLWLRRGDMARSLDELIIKLSPLEKTISKQKTTHEHQKEYWAKPCSEPNHHGHTNSQCITQRLRRKRTTPEKGEDESKKQDASISPDSNKHQPDDVTRGILRDNIRKIAFMGMIVNAINATSFIRRINSIFLSIISTMIILPLFVKKSVYPTIYFLQERS